MHLIKLRSAGSDQCYGYRKDKVKEVVLGRPEVILAFELEFIGHIITAMMLL